MVVRPDTDFRPPPAFCALVEKAWGEGSARCMGVFFGNRYGSKAIGYQSLMRTISSRSARIS